MPVPAVTVRTAAVAAAGAADTVGHVPSFLLASPHVLAVLLLQLFAAAIAARLAVGGVG